MRGSRVVTSLLLVVCAAAAAAGQSSAESASSRSQSNEASPARCESSANGLGGAGLAEEGSSDITSTLDQTNPLSALASDANQLRSQIVSMNQSGDSQGQLAEKQSIFDRLTATGDAVLAQRTAPGGTRILLHLVGSLEQLDPSLEISDRNRSAATEAVAWLRAVESIASANEDWALAAHARINRAEIYEHNHRSEDALLLARRAAFDAARAPHADSLYRAQSLVARVSFERGDTRTAIESYRAAVRTLETMRAAIALDDADEGLTFRSQVEPVYLGLVDVLLSEARSLDAENPGLAQSRLREARAVLEQFKEAELRDYFNDECLAGRSSADPDSIPGTVVVYPIALADRVEIIVSRGGRLSSHLAPIDGPGLNELAREFRRRLEDRTTRVYRRSGEALYDALIRPIETRLQESPIETVVFIPGGALRQIPMAALRDRETGRFLIERFPIAVAPSLTLTDPRRIDRSTAELLIGGLTAAVQGFPPLPNVAAEIETARTVFPGQLFLNERFTTRLYEQALQASPFDIVHIASHGQFSSDPAESFVLTWDEKLSHARLKTILSQTRFRTKRPIELLILSACETATDDERAALGLAGAAVQMGVRSVIASLWSVNDAASSELISRFYKELDDPSRSRAEALQRAQISMIGQEQYRHPSLWAPFLLINSWL